MSKAKQRFNTPYQQGMADGRLGRPFHYTKPPKPLRGRVPGYLVWYRPAYAAGYRAGRLSKQRYQLQWAGYPLGSQSS
jgi:hypothetical protein